VVLHARRAADVPEHEHNNARESRDFLGDLAQTG
jgi:hypothetical protein